MIVAMLFAVAFIFTAVIAVNERRVASEHIAFVEKRHRGDQDAYIDVLDRVRWFSNLDHKTTFSMVGSGGPQHRGWELMDNTKKDELHAAMKRLAAHFEEPDPCPCMRCVLAKVPNEQKVAALRGLPAFARRL